MDDDACTNNEPASPCCLKWIEKYTKLKEGRNALKQGIIIYNQQIAKMQSENLSLKKAYKDERTRADSEKDNKDKESAIRVSLEAEISSLKSEILSLNQHGGQLAKDVNQELESLRGRISKCDLEIKRLKELLDKERTRADIEKTKAQEEKKKADALAKKVQAERSKVNDDIRIADMERKKAEELKLQVEVLQSEAQDAKSKLALETKKLKEAKNMLIAERERTATERKQVELQIAKAEEQREVVESKLKLAMDERNRANHMSEQLDKTTQRLKELEKEIAEKSSGRIKQASAGNEVFGVISSEGLKRDFHEKKAYKTLEKVAQKLMREKKRAKSERKKVEEQKQVAEKYKKAAMDGKLHADQLAYELQYYKQRVEEMGKEIQKLLLPQALLQSFSHASRGSIMAETPEMKLLRKQLKLEKMRVKYAQKIAKVEKGQHQLLRQETFRLKQELLKFSQRLDTRDSCLLQSYGGVVDLEKLGGLKLQREHFGVEACEGNLQANGFTKSSCGTSSGTAVSALLGVESTVSQLSGGTRNGNNEKLASGAENIVGSPVDLTASKMRKRLHGELEPAEKLDSLGHSLQQQAFGKLSFPHTMQNHQMDKHLDENKLLVANGESHLYMKQSQCYKKMKSSSANTPALVHLRDGDELKTNPDTLGVECPDVCINAPSAVDNLKTLTQVGNEVLDDVLGNQHLPGVFDEIFAGDFLKSLDLDNDGYEERYRMAIQRPLSPTLPQIEFKSSEAPELCTSDYSSLRSSYMVISNIKEDLAPCSFDMINLEIDANTRNLSLPVAQFSSITSEKLYENNNNDQNFDEDPMKIWDAGVGSIISGEQNLIFHSENDVTPMSDAFPKYCVVFSENTDSLSISRIYRATSGCFTELMFDSASTFFQKVLPFLRKAEDLSAKEKVSVCFSLLLHCISDIAKADLVEKSESDLVQFIDSFAREMCAVLSDASTRRMLMQICDIHELFFLMEDFLLSGRVVMNGCVFKEITVRCLSMPKVSTDSCLSLSIQEASTHLLVAGGVALASVCAAIDGIGFLCEVSVNLLRIQLLNSWVIKLLHIFAYICGSRYFELEGYSLEMSVLKCLVVLLEKMNSSNYFTASAPSIFRDSSKYPSCVNCPFVDGVASVDDIAVLLLEKLQQCERLGDKHSDPRKTSDLSNGGWMPCGVGNKANLDIVNAHSSTFFSDEYLCHCMDILSLLELVACLMSWDWTQSNIIAPLLQMMEASAPEHLSTSIIILLGQLGRLGVDARGCEDGGVECLRGWLCGRLRQSYRSGLGARMQFAVGTALVGLMAAPFEEIVGSGSDPTSGTINQSVTSKCIREWFSSLSTEQMSSFRLLQAPSKRR